MTDERNGRPSASGLHRLVACPGSWNLECSIADDDVGPHAAAGTMVHEVLAGIRDGSELDALQQWVVQECRREESRLVAELGFADADVVEERRIWWKDCYSGRPDVIYLDRRARRALVIDYKSGRLPVPHAADNWQMRALAVLVACEHGLDEVSVAVIQPRAEMSVSLAHYDGADLDAAERAIATAVERAGADDAPRIPGAAQCRYCRARAVCPEARRDAFSVVPSATAGSPSVPDLTDLQIAEYLPRIEAAERIFEEIRSEAKRRLESSDASIDGYVLTRGARRQSIPDAVRAWHRLADVLEPEEFAAACSPQLARLIAIVAAKIGTNEAAARREVERRLGEAIQTRTASRALRRRSSSAD